MKTVDRWLKAEKEIKALRSVNKDLLEACKQLLDWYERPIDKHHKEYMTKLARAAIAKATT